VTPRMLNCAGGRTTIEPMDLGYRFSPNDIQRRFQAVLSGQSPLTPGQSSALQVLSLHVPRWLGASLPAPDALLRRSAGIRPDLAVRAQVTGSLPSAPSEPQDRPSMPAAAAAAAQPSNPASISSFGGSPNYQAQQSYINPFSTITDSGANGQWSTTPDNPNFTFSQPPRDSGPADGGGTAPLDLNGLMSSLFPGAGRGQGDSGGRGSRLI
jgi:hypothetical protein